MCKQIISLKIGYLNLNNDIQAELINNYKNDLSEKKNTYKEFLSFGDNLYEHCNV